MGVKEKLSELTTVPTKALNKLSDYLLCIYSNDIVTQALENTDVFTLELLEGTLKITRIDDVLHYKFIPNEDMTKVIGDAIITKKGLLEKEASIKLKNTLMNWRKELL